VGMTKRDFFRGHIFIEIETRLRQTSNETFLKVQKIFSKRSHKNGK
jgi:hypothetical protein